MANIDSVTFFIICSEMSLLKDLYLFKDEGIDDTLVYVDQFYKFVKERVSENDRGNVTRTNFLEELRRHKDGIKSLSHGKSITTTSVLRYIFRHFDDFNICHSIGTEIAKTICCPPKEQTRTLLELYKDVAKLDFRQVTSKLQEKVENYENDIPTLQLLHKECFTESEWMKICLFENYCSKYNYSSSECGDFEIELKKKWETLDYILSLFKVTKNWDCLTKHVIKERTLRQEAFERSQNVEVWTRQIHHPNVIEIQLRKRLDLIYPDTTVRTVCVDTDQSTESNSLMIIMSSFASIDSKEQERIAVDFLHTNHHVNVSHFVLLPPESFESYSRLKNSTARFLLRDDILRGKLKDCILEVHQPHQLLFEDLANSRCNACYDTEMVKSLSFQNFSLIKEWFFEVPLDMRIVLECFINRTSLYNSADKDAFLLSKLDRLYGTYDTLLNTFNKNYIGVLQQANTDELAMHYQSITTVFSIASNTGISSSYVTAENKIKEKATDELCYYNTYLKRFPLQYKTTSGLMAEHPVNLRNCHLILMMDNLVRLTFRTDPDPGENRSGQICTLPLTLQGLPKDNIVTEEWHLQNCQKEDKCPCKKKITLTENDFGLSLVEMTNEEKICWDRFQKVLVWGNVQLWRKIRHSKFYS